MSAKNSHAEQGETPDVDTAQTEETELPDTTDQNDRPVDNPSG